ncbi:MAG: two-component system LytT family sensor kinase [Crocinitomix sp.]
MKYIYKEERFKLIGFNDTKLMFVLVPFFAFFFPLMVFGLSPLEDVSNFWISYLISIIHIVIYWYFERWIILYIRRRYISIKHYRKRIIVQSVVVVFSTFGLCLLSETSEFCLGEVPEAFETSFFNKYMASLIITTIIISIYEGIYAFQLFKNGLVKNEELQRKNTQAQLDALKNQVNPHFLFNSLNTLISVIPEDTEIAVKFAENLSSVYRYILEIRDKELITLQEELDCIHAYQYLLSIRFGKHIEFEFRNLAHIHGKYVVPLSLQMLMENAIKHNIVSQSKPLTISISLEADLLKVCNNLQEKTQNVKSTGVGLKNIQQRYQLLANKEIKIEKTDEIFCVSLPILSLKEVK